MEKLKYWETVLPGWGVTFHQDVQCFTNVTKGNPTSECPFLPGTAAVWTKRGRPECWDGNWGLAPWQEHRTWRQTTCVWISVQPHSSFMTLGKNKTKKHKPQIFTLLICRMRRLREMTSFTEAEGGSGSEPWGCVTGLLQLTMPLSSASSASLTS